MALCLVVGVCGIVIFIEGWNYDAVPCWVIEAPGFLVGIKFHVYKIQMKTFLDSFLFLVCVCSFDQQ